MRTYWLHRQQQVDRALRATFEDGDRNACICDASAQSVATRRQVDLDY